MHKNKTYRAIINDKLKIFLFTFLIVGVQSFSQNFQTVRGQVTDKDNDVPLPGASVVLIQNGESTGVGTDEDGKFIFEKIPVGRQTFKVSFIGYKDAWLRDIEIVSGKQTVLNVQLIPDVYSMGTVEVKGTRRKSETVNEMISLSARTFSVEETSKYAGSWGDPARMAANFAGVTALSDKRNDIVVRGNSPLGVLWRMDGMEIPNPNHFSVAGSSGGAISMINNNLLSNSDFLSGAFPAEYGNATSAVFDLKMRQGNNEKFEFLGQAGVNGFEFGAEGPFKKGGASFLINYRYSTLTALEKIGITIIDAELDFQDLSFKLNFPVKKGTLSIFGIGGMSKANEFAEKDSVNWITRDDRLSSVSGAKMGVTGLTFSKMLSEKTNLRINIGYSANNPYFSKDSLGHDYQRFELTKLAMNEIKKSASIQINSKLNQKNKIRTGIIFRNIAVDNDAWYKIFSPEEKKITYSTVKGDLNLAEAFIQWKWYFSPSLTLNTGIHDQFLTLNNSNSIEPRASVTWNITPVHSLNIGFGMHSQMQPTAIYFSEFTDEAGNIFYRNKNLDFTKSTHYIISYDHQISENMRFKAEIYLQKLYDIPLGTQNPYYSLINFGYDDDIFSHEIFVNKGKGENYGLEFTFERFFHKNYYYLITTSLYNSTFTDSYNTERETRYNCNYTWNVLAGKEIKLSENNLLGFSATVVNIGGQRYTPIDIEESAGAGRTVYIDSLPFSEKYPAFFKIDIRIRFRNNNKKFSQEIALEMANILNKKNIENQYFDFETRQIKYYYLLGRIPVAFYRIEF